MVAALALVLTWRQPQPTEADSRAVTAPVPTVSPQPSRASHVPVKTAATDPLQPASRAVARIDSGVSEATARWRVAGELLPAALPGPRYEPGALARLIAASVQAESAAAYVQQAAAELPVIVAAQAGSGTAWARVGQLYSAERAWLTALTDEARYRLSYLRTFQEAVRVLQAGDGAEYDIKLNVATAELRLAEIAGRAAGRAHGRVRDARRSLGPGF
jgi:hypothetical protein